MLTRNVYYSQEPERVSVHRIGRNGYTARVDFPVNVQQIIMLDDQPQYKADVYSIEVGFTVGLKERIENNYEAWLAVAKEIPAPQPTINDVIEAVNELTDIVLGGE